MQIDIVKCFNYYFYLCPSRNVYLLCIYTMLYIYVNFLLVVHVVIINLFYFNFPMYSFSDHTKIIPNRSHHGSIKYFKFCWLLDTPKATPIIYNPESLQKSHAFILYIYCQKKEKKPRIPNLSIQPQRAGICKVKVQLDLKLESDVKDKSCFCYYILLKKKKTQTTIL